MVVYQQIKKKKTQEENVNRTHNKYNFRHDDFEQVIQVGNVQNRDAADI